MPGRSFALPFVLALVCGTATAHAEEPAREAEAREHFLKGVALLREDAAAEALVEFQRSRALFPTPKAITNAEVCLRRLGRFDEALDLVEALLAEFPNLPPDKVRAAQIEAEEISKRVGTVEVDGGPVGASVTIDGRERGTLPSSAKLRVSAGSRLVRVTLQGFEPFEGRVDVVPGKVARIFVLAREIVVIPPVVPTPTPAQRERVPDAAPSPPVATRKHRPLHLELAAAMLVAPTFAGDVATACGAGCGEAPGLGGYGVARGGYTFVSGWSIGIALGGLAANQTLEDRPSVLYPIGLPSRAVPVDDTLKLRGFLAGAWAGYARGDRLRVHLRAGAGAVIGTLADRRTGTFASSSGPSQTLEPIGDAFPATFAYVSPDLRLGLRVGDRIELTVGLEALLLFALNRPVWDASRQATTSRDGLARFDAESLAGAVMVALAPGFGVRYEL